MSDAVDGRSAVRFRNTIVRQNVTFPQIPLTLGCGASSRLTTSRHVSALASSAKSGSPPLHTIPAQQ
eukprot:5776659-Prymnesium_polylepis.1